MTRITPQFVSRTISRTTRALSLAAIVALGLAASTAAASEASEKCALDITVSSLDPKGSDPAGSFGRSAAVDGDWIAIGAPGNGASAGRVEMFQLVSGEWIHHSILVPAASAVDDRFGWSVALSGETLLVGATRADGASMRSGAAWVFDLVDEVWQERAVLLAPDGESDDAFGASVALSGDVAVIGAHQHDAVASNAGAAYVFRRSGDTGNTGNTGNIGSPWTLDEKLTDSEGTSNDGFGYTVVIDEATIAIAAPFDGVVHIHESVGDGGPWMRTALLQPPDTDSSIGRQLDLRGDTLVTTLSVSGVLRSVALVFTRVGSEWSSPRYLTSPQVEFNTWGPRTLALAPDAEQLVWTTATGPLSINLIWRDGGEWTTDHRIDSPAGFGVGTLTRSTDFDGFTMVGGVSGVSINGVISGRAFASTVPARDRDHDGLDDDCEIANGLDEDCDGDGLIDSVQRPFRFMADSAPADTAWQLPSTVDFAILNGFRTTVDGQEVRSVQWHRPENEFTVVSPTAVLVYLDADHDGDPTNAELISFQSVAATSTVDAGWVHIPIAPVTLGAAGTSFFIGLLFTEHGGASISSESSVPHRQTSWYAVTSGELDPKNLAAANLRPWELGTNSTSPASVVLLRAELSDCDASERLDLCEIAEGVLLDSNGDGVPDVCTTGFDPHDLDGDGVVGVGDLTLLLSLWGPCPAPPAFCLGDIDGDGSVGAADLGALLAAWSDAGRT